MVERSDSRVETSHRLERQTSLNRSRQVNEKPVKINLSVELELEAGRVDFTDPEERAWFEQDILGADPESSGRLLLHSNELGDTVGTVKVLLIHSIGTISQGKLNTSPNNET